MAEIIKTVRGALKNSIDEKTKATSQKFFKEKIKYFGVKVPTVNRISKEYYKLMESKTKSEIFDLCEAHQQELFDYVMTKKAFMPRTALRYAIKKMPEKLKASAMEKK